MTMTGAQATDLDPAIAAIHKGTAIYTAMPEIDALLDRLEWPSRGRRLLDPGAGNGGFLVAALSRLDLAMDAVDLAATRVRGYEFHPEAVAEARQAVADHLVSRGWSRSACEMAAQRIVEERDYLLSPVPTGTFDVIAANPPYWRYANIPDSYRARYDAEVASHAKADLLYAYLQRSSDIVADNGRIGLITADRWLLNDSSSELRRRIGELFTVTDVRRLESTSAFYRPKSRRKGSPARVHPVSLVLEPHRDGRVMTAEPFRIEDIPHVDGVLLGDLCSIRLAPWLGPDGIFVVDDKSGLPDDCLIPCIEPEDILRDEDRIGAIRRWAIQTTEAEPHPTVLAHLDGALERMPKRGRRNIRWMPPETFAHKLPLASEAIVVPRIATRLRAIPLPAGVMPLNHNLVVLGSVPAGTIAAWFAHPLVQAQADALALRVESGYRSYTASLLRRLIIPHDVIDQSV